MLAVFLAVALASLAVPAHPSPTVQVEGDLPRSGSLGVKELEALGATGGTWESHGEKHAFTGVALARVLASFGFAAGPRGKQVPIAQKRAGWRKVLVAGRSQAALRPRTATFRRPPPGSGSGGPFRSR